MRQVIARVRLKFSHCKGCYLQGLQTAQKLFRLNITKGLLLLLGIFRCAYHRIKQFIFKSQMSAVWLARSLSLELVSL
jgi:hypothetical protein